MRVEVGLELVVVKVGGSSRFAIVDKGECCGGLCGAICTG